MFGYRTAMKVEIIFKNLYPGYLPEQCVETWRIFRFFWEFLVIFKKRNILQNMIV